MQTYKIRSCPRCKGDAKDNIEIASNVPAEEVSPASLTAYWNGLFKENIFFSYHRCKICDLLYCKQYLREDQISTLYSQMPPNMDDVEIGSLTKTHLGYLKKVKKYLNSDGDFLEIGPDIGLFLSALIKKKSYKKYWLFEPNIQVRGTLESILQGSHYEISHEMTNFENIPEDSLSTIVMIHVFDHLIEPLEFLRNLKSKLKKGAKVIIITHDEKSLLRMILGKKWPPFCLQHPQIYNKKSIENMALEANYKLLVQYKTKNYFPVSFLIKNLFWIFKIKVNLKFLNFPIGLKLGNIMTILEN
jgi:2-polyprenyl-3-methyl-5-hydroxy-6-metoxy-1,4-benzoquinol methylase